MAGKVKPRRLDRGPKKIKNPPPPPEVLEKRAALVLATGGGDPVRASSGPLGFACEQHLIRGDDYNAGKKYASLHRRVRDRPLNPAGVSLDGRMNGLAPVDEEAENDQAKEYQKAREALKGAGTRAYQAVKDIAVFEHWPRFISKNMTRPKRNSAEVRPRELESIHAGLDALAKHFRTVTSAGNGPHRRRNDYI